MKSTKVALAGLILGASIITGCATTKDDGMMKKDMKHDDMKKKDKMMKKDMKHDGMKKKNKTMN